MLDDVHAFVDPLVVLRLANNHYALEGAEEEPMSRREMLFVVVKAFQVPVEEIAFMDLEFKEHPDYTRAYFGFNGTLLYCK